MKTLIALITLLASMASPTAFAADPDKHYIGVQVGKGDYSSLTGPSATPFGLSAGVLSSRFIGGEITYTNFGKVTAGSSSVDAWGIGANFILHFEPINNTMVFAKLGSTFVMETRTFGSSSYQVSAFLVTVGVGAQYNLTKHFGIKAGYDHNLATGTANYASTDFTSSQSTTYLGGVFNF